MSVILLNVIGLNKNYNNNISKIPSNMNLESVIQIQTKLFVNCLLTKAEVLQVPQTLYSHWDEDGNCLTYSHAWEDRGHFLSFYESPFYQNLLDGKYY